MADISISALKQQAQSTLKQMDQAYAGLGYKRVGGSYVKDPTFDAYAGAAGAGAGAQTVPISNPDELNRLGAPSGTNPAQVAAAGVTPDLATAGKVTDKTAATLTALSGLESLVPYLNNPKASSAFGPGGALNNWFRNTLHINAGSSDEERQFASSSKTVAQQVLNALSAGENGSNRPTGIDNVQSVIPGVGQTKEMAQSNYQSMRQRLLEDLVNTVKEYPNQAAKLLPAGSLKFSSIEEANKYGTQLPRGVQFEVWDNSTNSYRPATNG